MIAGRIAGGGRQHVISIWSRVYSYLKLRQSQMN